MADFEVVPGWILAACIFATLLGAWAIRRSCSIANKNSNVKKLITRTPPLSSSPKVGSVVTFEGEIQSPDTRSEFFGIRCSVWNSVVKAIFHSKEKKPNKGTVKHQPVIYREGNQSEPLIVSNRQTSIVLLVDKVLAHVVNPKQKSMTKGSPPNEAVKAVAKPKYEKYEVSEAYLPARSRVTILGVVVNSDNAYTFVSGDKKIDAPVVIYAGSKKEMLRYYGKRCRNYFGIAMVNLSVVVGCWGIQKPVVLFVSLPFLIAIAYKLKGIKQ